MNHPIGNNIANGPEQINNKNRLTDYIYGSVSRILERDEHNFFGTKKKAELTKQIEFTNNKIEELIKDNISSKDQVNKLETEIDKLELKNSQLKESLMLEIGS